MNMINKEYDIVIHWMVTNFCNFRCFYCCNTNVELFRENSSYNKINIKALSVFLKKINRIAKIVFSGGEPLLVENIIEAFSEITKNNYMILISNLVSTKVKLLAERINPEKVIIIVGSVHIHELNKYDLLDTFISHYNLLKKKVSKYQQMR